MRYRPYAPTSDQNDLRDLVARRAASTGHPPLSEDTLIALEGSDERALSFVAEDGNRIVGFTRAAATADSEVWSAEVVAEDLGFLEGVIAALVESVPAQRLFVWSPQQTYDQILRNHGFTETRQLWQLRRLLPMKRVPAWPDRVSGSTFQKRPETSTLVDINGRSFADHPERSNWSKADFARLRQKDWWDPRGLRLAVSGDSSVGFCWTKVHHPQQLGEIYVLAVDPGHSRRGIGEALTIEGLRYLSLRRGMTTGMLYVEEDNVPALNLYRKLGFQKDHVDSGWSKPLG